ncbi:MAG TPA: SpoIIE family protein phosphatase [Bryobacteraceae bacterium]|nr:SpoIIE family protein phosphatase [Bryobacteraceae bacterium]
MRLYGHFLSALVLVCSLTFGHSAKSINSPSGINSKSPGEREHAILLLSEKHELDLKVVLPALTGKLRDPAPKVRLAAAHVLGSFGPAVQRLSPSAEERLDAMLADSRNPEGRLAAAEALGRIGFHKERTLKLLSDSFRTAREPLSMTAGDALFKLGADAKDVVNDLTDVVVDTQAPSQLRHKAADILANMGDKASAAIPALIEVLGEKDTDEEVQEGAAWALGKIGPSAESLNILRWRLRTATRPATLSAIAWTVGRIGPQAESAIRDLLALVERDPNDPKSQQVRETAAQSIENIADDLSSEKHINSISQLQIAAAKFQRDPDTQVRRSGQSLADTTRYLIYLRRRRQLQQLRHYSWIIAIAALWAAWRLLLRSAPDRVLRYAESVDRWEQKRKSLANRRIGPSAIGIVLWFAYRSNVLNAWISRHSRSVEPQFNPKPSVPLPVLINDVACSELKPPDIRPAFKKPKKRIVITGEDKSGKTTLAGQIARWCLEEPKPEHTSFVRMFPVSLHASRAAAIQSDENALASVIQQRLAELLGQDMAPPPRLARALLERRLLIVIDCEAELQGSASDKDAHTAIETFPGKALMFISRRQQIAKRPEWDILETQPVPPDRILDVIQSALNEQRPKLSLSEPELSGYVEALKSMSMTDNIPLIAARMYAKELYIWRSSGSHGKLPETLPAIMQLHWEQSIRQSDLFTSDAIRLLRAIEYLAWQSVASGLLPVPVSDDQAKKILCERLELESDASNYLRLLVDSGIAQRVGADRILVTPSMLCEYLAAMYVVETYQPESTFWNEIVEQRAHSGDGLLSALWHCSFVDGPAKGIPLFCMEQLATRLQAFHPDSAQRYASRLEEYRQKIDAREKMRKLMGPVNCFKSIRIDLYMDVRQASNTSGDFPVLFPPNDDFIAICLVDIEGHGSEAAETAEKVKAALEQAPDWGTDDPRCALIHADKILRDYAGAGITMCLLRLDLNSRNLVYANAGMPCPLIFRPGKCIRLFANGVWIGSGYGSIDSPTVAEMNIEAGDTVVLFSDGFREALSNTTKHPFGENGIIRVVQSIDPTSSAHVIANSIFEAVVDHTGSATPQDDLTLVVVRILN